MFDWLWIDMFTGDLRNGDQNIRNAAIKGLVDMKTKKVIEAMTQSLNSDNSMIRSGAADVLGYKGGERSIVSLIQLLEKDDNYAVRRKAIEALGRIKDERVVDVLIKELNNDSAYLREMVARSLGNIGNKRAVGPLANLLEISYYSVEKYFIPLGGGWPIPSSLVRNQEAVINQRYTEISDKNHDARIEAARALGNIGGEDAIRALTKSLKNEKNKDVGYSNKEIIDTIEKALENAGHVLIIAKDST